MSESNQQEAQRILEILRSVREAQTDHGRVLDTLQGEVRSMHSQATYVAGIALLARHEAEIATARVTLSDERIEKLEERLTRVETRIGK